MWLQNYICKQTKTETSFHSLSSHPGSTACLCSSTPWDGLDTAGQWEPATTNTPQWGYSCSSKHRSMFMSEGAAVLTVLQRSCGGRWVQRSSGGALCAAGRSEDRCSSVTRGHAANRTGATVCRTAMPLWHLKNSAKMAQTVEKAQGKVIWKRGKQGYRSSHRKKRSAIKVKLMRTARAAD